VKSLRNSFSGTALRRCSTLRARSREESSIRGCRASPEAPLPADQSGPCDQVDGAVPTVAMLAAALRVRPCPRRDATTRIESHGTSRRTRFDVIGPPPPEGFGRTADFGLGPLRQHLEHDGPRSRDLPGVFKRQRAFLSLLPEASGLFENSCLARSSEK
jgi:hypothetical protein